MKVTIILNGLPGKKKKYYTQIHTKLSRHFDLDIRETLRPGHAEELAAQACNENAKVLLAAGGDGTLNQVINGALLNGLSQLPVFGLIPLGSGNDFARCCQLKSGTDQLIGLLEAMQPKKTDVGMLTCHTPERNEKKRFFINVSSIGMGPAVVKRLEKSGKKLGPSLSYLTSIFLTFVTHRPQEIFCKTHGWEWKGNARVVALANGQSFGHSIFIAPDAKVDDALLNTFIAGDLSLIKFLLFLQTLKLKKKINDPQIHYHMASQIELTSANACAIETDGELAGMLPATLEIIPGKINFLR